MLFNILIAVYLAVHLSGAVEALLPSNNQYYGTLAVLLTGVFVYLLLHGISYIFLIGQFEVTFPRILNNAGAGTLGFLAGLLVWSFITLVICTTPFCENKFVKDIGFGSKTFEEGKMQPYLLWWCGLVDKFAAGDNSDNTRQVLKDILTISEKHTTGKKLHETTTTPNQTVEPNTPPAGPVQPNHTVIPP